MSNTASDVGAIFYLTVTIPILECNTFVAPIGPLSINENAENIIKGGHPETDVGQNNNALILLALFIPWN